MLDREKFDRDEFDRDEYDRLDDPRELDLELLLRPPDFDLASTSLTTMPTNRLKETRVTADRENVVFMVKSPAGEKVVLASHNCRLYHCEREQQRFVTEKLSADAEMPGNQRFRGFLHIFGRPI